MEGIHIVCVLFLCVLPLGLNGTVTPKQNHHSTNEGKGEITTNAYNEVTPSKLPQHLSTDHSTEMKLEDLQSQTQEQVSTRNILRSYWSSMGPLRMRNLEDNQLTGHRENSTAKITTKGDMDISPTMVSQTLAGQETASIRHELSLTEPATLKAESIPLSIPELSTKMWDSQTPSLKPNQIEKIQRGLALTIQMSQANLSPTNRGPTGPFEQPRAATSGSTPSDSPVMTTPQTPISTQQTTTTPPEASSTTAATVTAGDGGVDIFITKRDSTPIVTTKKPVAPNTSTRRKLKLPPTKMENKKSSKKRNQGSYVAMLIGGALMLMMVGFGAIVLRMKRLKKKQLKNTAWAGPSPFLDDGDNNHGHTHLRSFNRISLASFLPQRLSKRLSLLQETDQEFQVGDFPAGSTFGREPVAEEVQPSNGAAAMAEGNIQTQEAPDTILPSPQITSETTATTNQDPDPPAPLQDVDLWPDNKDAPPPPTLEDPEAVPSKVTDKVSPPSRDSADMSIPP